MALPILLSTSLAQAGDFDHRAWDELLKRNVVSIRQGQVTQVDYGRFRVDAAKLQSYLIATSAVSRRTFDAWSPDAQLAFLINVYNARTVELVLTAFPNLESIKELGTLFQSAWKKRFVSLFGATRSLDEVEHDLIRGSGRYNDPRIHFAVNCASVGCPALRPEAYTGERVNEQLENQTVKFLLDRSRNRLEGKTLRVSAIFSWYRKDFERGWNGINSLSAFLARYARALMLTTEQHGRLLAGEIDIEFLDYDWSLNDKRS
ncbi:MAG: DUF547 domain-containing protein [Steroidobacteraceae bacterium]